MSKRAVKAGLLILEGAAILLAVFGGCAAFLFWRLESSPVSVALFKPSIIFAVERRLPEAYHCSLEGIFLQKGAENGEYVIRLAGLRVIDGRERDALDAAGVDLVFRVGDSLRGDLGPRAIVADGVQFSIIRNKRHAVEIPAVRSKRRKSPILFLAPVFDGRILNSAFRRAEIKKAEITFFDEASGRSWTSDNATVSIDRNNDRLSAAVNGDIDLQGTAAAFTINAQYTEQSGVVTVDAKGENFPVGDVLSMFYGENAAIVDAPVSGAAVVSFTSSGKVLSSRFSGRLEGGVLRLNGMETPFDFIEWRADFDPASNKFAVERFAYDVSGNRGVLVGDIGLTFKDDIRAPQAVTFDLSGEDMVLNLPGKLAEPLPLDAMSATGGYRFSDKRITISAFKLSLLDILATGSFAKSSPQADAGDVKQSPAIALKLDVVGALDPERLLKIWPLGPAAGVRNWIADRLETATIDNIHAHMDLPAGAVSAEGGVPDDALEVTFDVNDAKAYFVKQMTPLTRASGKGVLRGNSFRLTVERGRVGDIAISDGEIEFPTFIPKWQPTYYRFSASGRSEAMLTVLNQEPLVLLSKIRLSPEQFQGDARVRVEIMRPNKSVVPTTDYRYNGTATFENMRIAGLSEDMELTSAKGKVELKPRKMTISAEALLADAPLDVVWRQNFFKEDGPSSFKLSGTLDAATADLFGLSMRRYLRGPVEIDAKATGDIGAFTSLDVTFDFSAAAASFEPLGWLKPAGAAAAGEVHVDFDDGGTSIKSLKLAGDGVDIIGRADIAGGAIQSADFQKFYLENAADVSFQLSRKPSGELSVTAVGPYLNAGALIQNVFGGEDGGDDGALFSWGGGVAAAARIDRLMMRKDVAYTSASLDLWRDADRFQTFDFSALGAGGAPTKLTLSHDGGEDEGGRVVVADTGDVGEFLRGFFGVTSISGGEGNMQIELPSEKRKGVSGVLEAQGLHVVKAPLLARIFSAGSLDGLAKLVNGEGIDFSYAYGKFDLASGVLSIKDFRATGPSVGLTAEGAMATGEGGEVSLSGALAPVYQLNSVLGNAPIIGDILVGKKGEGVLALSYSVSGKRTSPEVFVNPLSALTPGIFRQMFQPGHNAVEAVGDRPDDDGDKQE